MLLLLNQDQIPPEFWEAAFRRLHNQAALSRSLPQVCRLFHTLTQPFQTSFSFTASRKSAARWTYPLEALGGRQLPSAQAHSIIRWLRKHLQHLETLEFVSLLWNEDLWERCGCSVLDLLRSSGAPAAAPCLIPSNTGGKGGLVVPPIQNLRSLTLSFHLGDGQLLMLAQAPCCGNLTKLGLGSSRKKGTNTLPEVGHGLCCLLAGAASLQDLQLSSFQLPREAPCDDLVFPQGLTKLMFTSSRFCASLELICRSSLTGLRHLKELELSDPRETWWHGRMWSAELYGSCRVLTQLTRIPSRGDGI